MARKQLQAMQNLWLPGFDPEESTAELINQPLSFQAEIIPFPIKPIAQAVDTIIERKNQNHSYFPAGFLSATWNDLTRFEDNMSAIRLVKCLQQENRIPTKEERAVLMRYVGWGGLPKAFELQLYQKAKNLQDELKSLLSDEEFKAAVNSVSNAHYTSECVTRAMWRMAQRLGFKGGRVLESSCGIGGFLGMAPEEIVERSQFVAVENDPATGSIAQALFPDATILVKGFEEVRFPNAYFNLVIGNVPFGDYRVHDPDYARHRFRIHDYFIARSVDLLMPGGLAILVTSVGTMDKLSSKVRHYLDERAELVSAIRLPCTAFQSNANTGVTTDILVFQKRARAVEARIDWLNVMIDDDTGWEINPWFYVHPEQVLGRTVDDSNPRSRGYKVVPFEGRQLAELLAEATSRLPENILEAEPEEAFNTWTFAVPEVDDAFKEGQFVVHGDALYRHTAGRLVPAGDVTGKAVLRVAAMCAVREALQTLMSHQVDSSMDENAVENARAAFCAAYERMKSKFGAIHERENIRAFEEDPDLPLLMSLEDWDPDSKAATPAEIFTARTAWPHALPKSADNAKDGLIISLDQAGNVNPSIIGELCGRDSQDVIDELAGEGVIYLDPEGEKWVMADEYLSGHVRHKLAVARAAATIDPCYLGNVEALERVIPEDIPPTGIHVRLGSPWVPQEIVTDFVIELLDVRSDAVRVVHTPTGNLWMLEQDRYWYAAKNSVANTATWGTKRYTAMDLIEAALNLKTPAVYDTYEIEGRERRVLNIEETESCRNKLSGIQARFTQWCWEDASRRDQLVRLYNDRFNAMCERKYDGSHLTLPGLNAAIKLRANQKNAIWRVLQNGNTLLAHCVGAGKTYTMQCTSMELRRLRLANKPAHIVPNHLLMQYASEFMRAYPAAKLLVVTKKDVTPARRKAFVAKCAIGNWDAVIMTHTSFERIGMSRKVMQDYKEEVLGELDRLIEDMKNFSDGESKKDRTLKRLISERKRLDVKLSEMVAEGKHDDGVTFEQLGVDQIFFDEAHALKNGWIRTKMDRIPGIPSAASQRALDALLKTRHIMSVRGGENGVVFATATPVTNTLCELFVMQRYLQPETLRRFGIDEFDAWAGNFGESVTQTEVAPDGSGYRQKTRFAKFANIPELMGIFRAMADVLTADDIGLPRPKLEGGGPIVITCTATPELKAYVESLVERAEKVRDRQVPPEQDNMLLITSDGRKAALDMRLVSPSRNDHPNYKANVAARNIYDIWRETADRRLVQMVFCDISTPKANAFNIYDELKGKLVGMGMPAEEIAFIHHYESDEAKAGLFRQLRAGDKRLILGSTEKLGTGTNVQRLLYVKHDLDAPWRPSDLEQRDGRIERQGNLNDTIRIYRYVTPGSFDVYSWQILELKQRFIGQVMHGDSTLRTIEDVDDRALSYAEVKAIASGNPLIKEKAGVDSELARLDMLRSTWGRQKYSLQRKIDDLDHSIAHADSISEKLRLDIQARQNTRGDLFRMQLRGQTFVERATAGEQLLLNKEKTRREALKPGNENLFKEVGKFAGFKVVIRSTRMNGIQYHLSGHMEYEIESSDSGLGYVARMENQLNSLEGRLQGTLQRQETNRQERAKAIAELSKPFEHEARIETLLVRQIELEELLDLDGVRKTKNDVATASA